MKQLLIVRHSKSDRNDLSLKDFDRPLNDRGHKNAQEMATRLFKQNIIPQILVSSSALRALTTANYFADKFTINHSAVIKNEDIYEASSSKLLKIINGFDNKANLIGFFGHNPGFSELAFRLSNNSILDNLPTTGIALIEFPFDKWNLVSYGTGKLLLFDFPKNVVRF